MKLSLADRVAMLYTRDGSMRGVAKTLGLTHQQVSRILHNQFDGRSNAYYERQNWIVGAVDHAYAQLQAESKEVARAHKLPYNGEIPIFTQRLRLRKQSVSVDGQRVFTGEPEEVTALLRGKTVERVIRRHGQEVIQRIKLTPEQRAKGQRLALLGDRVGAEHMHWVRDELRNKWLLNQRRSGKYDHVSIGSDVNLPTYMKTARQRINAYLANGGITTEERLIAKDQLEKLNRGFARDGIEKQDRIAKVYTPYVTMDPKANAEVFLWNVNNTVNQRHSPATGAPKTKLASTVLFQIKPLAPVQKREASKPRRKASAKKRVTRSPRKK